MMFLLDLSHASPTTVTLAISFSLTAHPTRQELLPSQPPVPFCACSVIPVSWGWSWVLPGTQESGHMCSRCCHGPESFPTWGCQFCRDWQFLSVLNRILCNHLLLHLDILYLETRHLSPILLPTFSFNVADAGHTVNRPAHSGSWLIVPSVFCSHKEPHSQNPLMPPVLAPRPAPHCSLWRAPARTASVPHSCAQEVAPTS